MTGEEVKQTKTPPAQVVILDGGSQFTGQVDRTVRELGYRCDIVPLETPAKQLQKYKAVIYTGGPDSVFAPGSRQCDPEIHERDLPELGICYGMQLIAQHFGGVVGDSGLREDGRATTKLFGSPLFQSLGEAEQIVWMSHGDSVLKVPEGFEVIGGHQTGSSVEFVSAIANEQRKIYGVQFHPEVHGTLQGKQIVKNFLNLIAGLKPDYSLQDQLSEAQTEIKRVVGEREVVMYLSGGVDSTVMAALMAKTLLPQKIHAFLVDHGFMRAGEVSEVHKALTAIGIELNVVDAKTRFQSATIKINGAESARLDQVVEPQLKRQIIGDTFDTLLNEIVAEQQLPPDAVLAMGTIRPDLIESGSVIVGSKQKTIKTHHNDTEQVRGRRERGDVVEPLKWLYKDQVRELGRRLGLPDHLVDRQPFPGPGLAIRVICATAPTIDATRQRAIQARLDEFIANYQNLPAGFEAAEVLPLQTVGVQGESRTYDALVVLKGEIKSWADYTQLTRAITNQQFGVNRVTIALKDAPLSSLITETHLTDDVLGQLRQADKIVSEEFSKAELNLKISQLPVILLPASYERPNQRTVALRPFISPDFTTGRAAIPGEDFPAKVLSQTGNRILKEVDGITQVIYDLTDKPPGTTEWE